MPIALNSDGTVVAVGGSFVIRFFDTASGGRWRDDLLIRLELDPGTIQHGLASTDLGFMNNDTAVFGSGGATFVFDLSTGAALSHGQAPDLLSQNPPVATAPGIELRRSGLVSLNRPTGPLATATTFSTPMANGSAVALSTDEQRIAIASSEGVALFALGDTGLLAEGVPRREATSVSIDRSGDRVVLDYFWQRRFTLDHHRADDGRWTTTRRDFDTPASVWISPVLEQHPNEYEIVGLDIARFQLVDPATGDVVGEMPAAPAFALASDTELALGLDSGMITIHDYPSGTELSSLGEMKAALELERIQGVSTYTSLDANRALGRLTAVTLLGAVGSWDTETWEFELLWEESDIHRLAYHPEGLYAVTSDEHGTIKIRNADTLEPVGDPLVGHTAAVGVFDKAFAFFGERYLVSMGQDQTLRLWNIETGTQIGDPLPTVGPAAFAVETRRQTVATGTDVQFLLWNYRLDEWFDVACRAAGRNLTRDEWIQFGPVDEPYRETCPQWASTP